MKILVVSDTHGRERYLYDTLQRVKPIDLLIHLGDFEGGEEYIRSIVSCPVEFVSGNNDFSSELPREKFVRIGRYTVMMTHGHRYGVSYDTGAIWEAAIINHADIVMFGHTHIPMINRNAGIWLINPGSLSLPRQEGRIPTFVIMDIDSKGEVHFTLNYVNKKR
jgi:putative phosphoesterase